MSRKTKVTKALTVAAGVGAALACASAGEAALTFTVGGSWPDDARRTAAVNAMQAVVNRYNVYGDFGSYNIYTYYNSGIPTAQSNYLGSIGFGGTYPNERVAEHESNHYLGSGTYWNWANKFNGSGVWTGPKINELIQQFDGDGAVIKRSGVHFYPYGLNYDSEVVNASIYMRNIAIMYAMRQDMGNGTSADPWSATTVALAASDLVGTSAFNWFGGGYSGSTYQGWSDKYFAHPGAAYSTGDFTLRTPLDTYNPGSTTPSFTFRGDSLTINNTNDINGRLLFNGIGTTSVLKVNNLILDGGYVRHSSGAGDLFQVAGNVTLKGTPTIDAAQGDINVLAPIGGTGSLTKAGGYTLTLNGSNTFAGAANITAGKLVLNNAGLPNTSGVTVSSGAVLIAKGSISTGGTMNSSGTVDLADGGLGTLTAGGGVTLSNSALNLDLSSSGADKIAASGPATVSGTNIVNLAVLGQGVGNGTSYTILTASGGLDAANFVMGRRANRAPPAIAR